MYVHAGTIRRYHQQQFTEIYPIEYHVIRFGDIAMVTNPFELFLDYANRMKARSYAEQTFIVQLCCGGGLYLPTENYEKGKHKRMDLIKEGKEKERKQVAYSCQAERMKTETKRSLPTKEMKAIDAQLRI